jgi:hypothetical protein
MHEGVSGEGLSSTESNSGGGVERASEFIAVNNAENAAVHVKISTNGEVFPGVVVSRSVRGFGWGLGDDVAFEEDALGDSSVFNTGLNNVHSVIFEVVEYNALTEAIVLVSILNNGFLEVGVEFEYLTVMLEPLGGNLGYGIVALCRSLGHTAKAGGGSFAHGLEHSVVYGFLQIGGFL